MRPPRPGSAASARHGTSTGFTMHATASHQAATRHYNRASSQQPVGHTPPQPRASRMASAAPGPPPQQSHKLTPDPVWAAGSGSRVGGVANGVRGAGAMSGLAEQDGEIALPGDAGVRSVPLAGPTPLYAWSLIWLSQDRHPLLRTLLRRFAETGLRRRWLEYDAARDWLPAHDQAELRRLEHMTAHPGA